MKKIKYTRFQKKVIDALNVLSNNRRYFWLNGLQIFDGTGTSIETTFADIKGDPYDNALLSQDLNSKLDKVTVTETSAYVSRPDGRQDTIVVNNNKVAYTLCSRDANGNVKVGTPIDDTDATPKSYVDDGLDAKLDSNTSTTNSVYAVDGTGVNRNIKFSSSATVSSIMYRDSNGNAKIADPIEPNDIANKNYVDNHSSEPEQYLKTIVKDETNYQITITDKTGITTTFPYSSHSYRYLHTMILTDGNYQIYFNWVDYLNNPYTNQILGLGAMMLSLLRSPTSDRTGYHPCNGIFRVNNVPYTSLYLYAQHTEGLL